MTYAKTPIVDGNPATDQLQERSVHEDIKDLIPQDCWLTKLSKVMKVDRKTGKVTQSGGLIPAKVSNSSRVEAFSHTPEGETQVAGACSAGTGATAAYAWDVVLADAATQILPKMVFQNTSNNTKGIVGLVNGTTVSFEDFGSDFTPSVGDTLLYIGPAAEYGSSSPDYIRNTDDNHYNIMGIYRHAIESTLSAKDTKQLAGGNIHERMKSYKLVHHVRAVERNWIWGERPASGNTTTVTIGGVEVAFPHPKGLFSQAQKTYSFNGAMTLEKIKKNLPLAMDRSVDVNSEVLWLMSKQARAEILSLLEGNAMLIRSSEGNKYKKWGITTDVLITAGPDILIGVHDAFNYGANVSKGLIISPWDLMYYFKNGEVPKGLNGGKAMSPGRNWNIIMDTQAPGTDTKKDEIFNEGCFLATDGGYSMTTTTNML